MKKNWLFALLILFLLFLTLSRFEGWNLLHSVKQIPLWPVSLLLGLQVVSQLLVNLMWYKVAQFAGIPISFYEMFYINCHGSIMDSITPGVKFGGEVTRAVLISRLGNCSGKQAAAVVAIQKLFSLSAFFLISLFAVNCIIGFSPLFDSLHLQFLVYGILILFLMLFSCLFFIPQRIKASLQARENTGFIWTQKIRVFLCTLLDGVIAIRKNTKACVMLCLLSLLIWLIYPAKMYLLAIQISPSVSLMYTTAVTFVSYLVAMLPIFPGGLGGFEATMIGLLLAMGFMESEAFIVTVIFRFVTFWFVLLLGILFIVFTKIQHKSVYVMSTLKTGR